MFQNSYFAEYPALLLTLNIFHTFFSYFFYCVWTNKCLQNTLEWLFEYTLFCCHIFNYEQVFCPLGILFSSFLLSAPVIRQNITQEVFDKRWIHWTKIQSQQENIVDKIFGKMFKKLSKIGFSMEYFTAGLWQLFSRTVKISLLGCGLPTRHQLQAFQEFSWNFLVS